jgi:hypothetical protein
VYSGLTRFLGWSELEAGCLFRGLSSSGPAAVQDQLVQALNASTSVDERSLAVPEAEANPVQAGLALSAILAQRLPIAFIAFFVYGFTM